MLDRSSKEYKREYLKEWRKRNPDKVKLSLKKYNDKNKIKLSEYKKEWAQNHPEHLERVVSQNRTPVGRYRMHKKNAEIRGIEWKFTFDTWWDIWQKSGKWEQRGRGGYVMCRHNDSGPYSPENVRIDTASENIKEGFKIRAEKDMKELALN